FFDFFFSSRRRHTRSKRDWSSDVCSSDLILAAGLSCPDAERRRADCHQRRLFDRTHQQSINTNVIAGSHHLSYPCDHTSRELRGARVSVYSEWSMLSEPELWIEALTQNAWDPGAAWGLILTYGAYMRKKDDITVSAFQTGIGNNIVSLMSAIIIFSTVFGTLGGSMSNGEILEIMKTSGPASTGLTFMWLPQLFDKMAGGRIF